MVERECHVPIPQKAGTDLKKNTTEQSSPSINQSKSAHKILGKNPIYLTKKSDIFGQKGCIAWDNEVQS